ncbi:MAG: glycosyltransferase family 2 protein [Acidobacteriota bacterium]
MHTPPEDADLGLSVVIPVFNEEASLPSLFEGLRETLAATGRTWEILFVDDGSKDHSAKVIRGLCDREPGCTLIRFRRNFGQTAALAAGLNAARGRVVVTMDADGQNDPSDIPRLLEKLDEGYDLVNGWRRERRDPFLNRRLPSQIANRLISLITGVRLHDFGCALKAMRREIAQDLKLYGEMHRFIPAIATQIGAQVIEIPVTHHPRVSGHSNYGISRTFRVAVDLITIKFLSEYATRPGHLFGLLGLAALVVGASITGFLVIERAFFHSPLADRPLLLLSIFLTLVGIQLITMGLIGEMLSRIYHESQQKPIYVIRETYRRATADGAARGGDVSSSEFRVSSSSKS